MVAGEFAVLEPYQKLIVMAVDRFVYATLEPSEIGVIHLESFRLHDVKWHWDTKEKKVVIESSDDRTKFLKAAMTIAMAYIDESDIIPETFTLTIKSELDDDSGLKYGLGSSAAVVTAVVKAILTKFLPELPSDEEVFKLASIAHVITQGNGSGADVAASSFGGFLQYSSFQADWLIDEYQKKRTLKGLVKKNWQYFSVKKLTLPASIFISVGWTGTPASTANLVDNVLSLKTSQPSLFHQFLANSHQAVQNILQGIEEEDFNLLKEGVQNNRQALATVGKHANVDIETPLLAKLCEIAEKIGGAGKPSGAGGGDCGIAFTPSKETKKILESEWKEEGIKPLMIHAY